MVHSLQTGSTAPAFSGVDTHNTPIALKDFQGKKILLYFYPKDDTPGCTKQACNLRDNLKLLEKNNIQIIGVSTDSSDSHQKFSEKYQLPFPLIADTDKKIATLYGVYGEKNNYGKTYMGIHRTSFLIDEKGIILHIFKRPKTDAHAEEILRILN